VAAALLAVPGASAYFLGGGVVYTGPARAAFLGLPSRLPAATRSASEPYAALCAHIIAGRLGADWGLAETGAAGPSGNRYGDEAGHCCIAVSGPKELVLTVETGSADREDNMWAFARAALDALERCLRQA
jgi:nicotinamide mononucleotide (NMN) deamidase PncC